MLNLWIPEFIHGRLLRSCRFGQHKKGIVWAVSFFIRMVKCFLGDMMVPHGARGYRGIFAIEYQCCGRANIKTTLLNILKGFFAASLFTRLPVELYRFTVTLQNTFTKDLIGTASGNVLELAREVLYRYSPNGVNALNGFGLLELLFLIALGYCVIKVFFSNIKRGGILLTQIAVGSLYLFSLPRGYADGFTQWCKQVVALCLTTFNSIYSITLQCRC